MRNWSFILVRLLVDRRGATAVEYGLILAMVVLAMFGALYTVGARTGSMWSNVSSAVVNAH